jgi:hypothetical protein
MFMRVKDMPRRQQKAVFAKNKDPSSGYLTRLEGAEGYQRRRNYLIKKQNLSEETEDKIFNVYNDRTLTHRQKMARIAEIKKDAQQDLTKLKAEDSTSIVKDIKQIRQRKYDKIELEEVGGNDPPKGTPDRAEWNAYNYGITTTRQYKKHREKGDHPIVARDKAMEDVGITPETQEGKWYSTENLPERQRVVARRYKKRLPDQSFTEVKKSEIKIEPEKGMGGKKNETMF